MNKKKTFAYILLIVIIIIFLMFIYFKEVKEKKKTREEKPKTEIYFLENTVVTLLNSVNNIETRNYNVSIEKIPNNQRESNKENNNDMKEKDDKKNSGENKEELFELKHSGVLNFDEKINWKQLKNEAEIVYNSIPTITLELYEYKIANKEIVDFNKEFDKLIIAIKNENKQEALKILSNIYEYISKFINNTNEGIVEKTFIEAKSNVFKAYSILDSQNWEEIKKHINKSIEVYSKLLGETNIEKEKRNVVNKGYVMLNELNNAIELKDKSVFLIKYKNLLEEINNI